MSNHMTLREAATVLARAPRTVRGYIDSGKLQGEKERIGKIEHTIIPREAVYALKAELGPPPPHIPDVREIAAATRKVEAKRAGEVDKTALSTFLATTWTEEKERRIRRQMRTDLLDGCELKDVATLYARCFGVLATDQRLAALYTEVRAELEAEGAFADAEEEREADEEEQAAIVGAEQFAANVEAEEKTYRETRARVKAWEEESFTLAEIVSVFRLRGLSDYDARALAKFATETSRLVRSSPAPEGVQEGAPRFRRDDMLAHVDTLVSHAPRAEEQLRRGHLRAV